MTNVALVVLHVLLALYVLQGLLKFALHFLVRYETRRRRIDATYKGRQIALFDDIVLLLMVLFIALLVVSGQMEYLSFTTGLVVGMTLIQVYFHRYSVTLPRDKAPDAPVTPIKLMSYAIQANPRRAWREYAFLTVLLGWALVMLLTQGFGRSA